MHHLPYVNLCLTELLLSLLSPVRSPVVGGDSEIVLIATLYKERFPKATKQMEERLQNFIRSNETLASTSDIAADSVAIVRFVHHQVLEMARDCLQKSEDKLITRYSFLFFVYSLLKCLLIFNYFFPTVATSTKCQRTSRNCSSRPGRSPRRPRVT